MFSQMLAIIVQEQKFYNCIWSPLVLESQQLTHFAQLSRDILLHSKENTLFSFIFAALKFRENFLGTFRESLISRSQRKIVFTGN